MKIRKENNINLFEGVPVIFITILLTSLLLFVLFSLHLARVETYRIESALNEGAKRIEIEFDNRINYTYAIIENMNLQIAKNPYDKIYINQIINKFRTAPELSEAFSWTVFSWADANNKITVDAKYGIMKQPFDLSGRDYIPLTIEKPEKLHLGNPVFGSTSNQWMIPGGVGVADKNGKYVGAMTIGFSIESLAKSLAMVVENSNLKFALLDKDGNVVVPQNAAIDALAKLQFEELKNSGQNYLSDIALIKNKHGIFTKKIDNSSYYVVLEYDSKTISNQMWQSIISRLVEILFLAFATILLLIFVYKKEQKQTLKILALKRLVEKTHEVKNEFILKSSKELEGFVSGVKGRATIIKNTLERETKFKNEMNLSADIISMSDDLAKFIEDMIDLNKRDEVEIKVSDYESDIVKVVKRSISLLQKIANKPNIILVNQIEDNLHNLSEIDPNRVKQIIINLVPDATKRELDKGHIEILIKNANDNEKTK